MTPIKPILAIFDLDHTVIDSSHRVEPCILEGGDLDLNKYRKEACTREQVYKDTLLPLAEVMKGYMAQGAEVAICTARHMFRHDYDYLKKVGLKPRIILSRDKLYKHFGDRSRQLYVSGDATYKGAYLELLKTKYPNHELVLYDDHQGVLAQARKHGVRAIDALSMNKRIETFNAVGFS